MGARAPGRTARRCSPCQKCTSGTWRQGKVLKHRNSLQKTLCPAVIGPYLCSSHLDSHAGSSRTLPMPDSAIIRRRNVILLAGSCGSSKKQHYGKPEESNALIYRKKPIQQPGSPSGRLWFTTAAQGDPRRWTCGSRRSSSHGRCAGIPNARRWYQCPWKKHSSRAEEMWKDKLLKHQIKGWRALFQAGLHGQG